ncbi:MAG: hypothetical protein H0X26_00595 [Alphaproteobacteria bacterium]|nr:hypothetical protein [Alphaproteobacteria bacterium]
MLTKFKILPVAALAFCWTVGAADADTTSCTEAMDHCKQWYGSRTATTQDACTVWSQHTEKGQNNYTAAWYRCCRGEDGIGAPAQPCIANPDCDNANTICLKG